MQVAREFLTLRAFSQRARSVPTARKEALALEAQRVVELRRAAEVLWNGGSPAQGFRLLRETLAAAVAHGRQCTGVDAASEPSEVLRTTGLSDARVQAAIAILRELEALAQATVDTEVTAAHVQLFPRVRDLLVAIEEAAEPYGADDARVARLRREHWVRTAVVGTALLVALILFFGAQFRTKVTGSATYDANHEAPNVLDGNPDSEWLLPNGAVGWIDVQLSPSRTVSRLRLINAHNFPHNDRGTKEFRIEIYSGNNLVKSVDAEFPEFKADPTWTTFEFGETRKVTRVRLVVKTFFTAGGGFAEIRVD